MAVLIFPWIRGTPRRFGVQWIGTGLHRLAKQAQDGRDSALAGIALAFAHDRTLSTTTITNFHTIIPQLWRLH